MNYSPNACSTCNMGHSYCQCGTGYNDAFKLREAVKKVPKEVEEEIEQDIDSENENETDTNE